MARLNVSKAGKGPVTHEGGAAVPAADYEAALRRSVMACLLWENQFYEDGVAIAQRIADLVHKVNPIKVHDMAIEARSAMKLRHAPLLLMRELARHPQLEPHERWLVRDGLEKVIQRADELAEFLAIYWAGNNKKRTLSAQVKKGLGRAFTKFNEYGLAKYDQKDAKVKLRDALFLSHAKPKDPEQAALWKRLIDGELAVPDTWEVALSATKGEGKKEEWERLLHEEKLFALALLRNLRNMIQAGVNPSLIEGAVVKSDMRRVLPFRFIAAARYAPFLEPVLGDKMVESAKGLGKLAGSTAILVDVSGSMENSLSARHGRTTQPVQQMDAAAGLAVILREVCERVRIFSFSQQLVEIPVRRGFALRDAIVRSQQHGGTYLGSALEKAKTIDHFDRTIVVTDEQSHEPVGPPAGKGYMMNVASFQYGVGFGDWTRITGFSESLIQYIVAVETGKSTIVPALDRGRVNR